MLNYYAHAVSKFENFMLTDFTKLEDVFKNGCLLSRRRLGLSEDDALFNGMDYISLCDLSKEHPFYSAYNMYIKKGISLLFDKSIKVIEPRIVSIDHDDFGAADVMHYYGTTGRFSDLVDEVQARDEVPLSYFKGILLSLDRIKSLYSDEYVKNYFSLIKYLLEKYHYNVPIINLDNEKELKLKK